VVDERAGVGPGIVGIVDDESAALVGQGADHGIDGAYDVLTRVGRRRRCFGEARPSHGGVQSRHEQPSGYLPVLQLDFDSHGSPAVHQLRAEDSLAVAGSRLDNDKARTGTPVSEAGPGDVVRGKAAHLVCYWSRSLAPVADIIAGPRK
jgi:hypothetical protein